MTLLIKSSSKQRDKHLDWPERYRAFASATRHAALQRFYACGTVVPETQIGNAPLVALDLETTGLDPQRHGIVSIGLVPFDCQRIRVRQGRYWVVRPRRELEQDSVAIHHLTHNEVEQAPDLVEILPELLSELAGRIVVVHYRNIERAFLLRSVKERLDEWLIFPLIDTMQLEARQHRVKPAGWQGWIRKLLVPKPGVSLRLAASRSRYRLPRYQAHHALIDALATAELLQAQIAHHYDLETPVSELWC